MRTIIAGTRSIWNYDALDYAIGKSDWNITQVVCGMAPGMDSVGWAWAHVNNIPIAEFPADWAGLGKYAGLHRNIEMARNADALILIWDGTSRGSGHMLKTARHAGLQTLEILDDAPWVPRKIATDRVVCIEYLE